MKVSHVILAGTMCVLAACKLAAQTPVLGSIEAPHPGFQSHVRIAGATYGPGAVPYGPAGAPLVLSGPDCGGLGLPLTVRLLSSPGLRCDHRTGVNRFLAIENVVYLSKLVMA